MEVYKPRFPCIPKSRPSTKRQNLLPNIKAPLPKTCLKTEVLLFWEVPQCITQQLLESNRLSPCQVRIQAFITMGTCTVPKEVEAQLAQRALLIIGWEIICLTVSRLIRSKEQVNSRLSVFKSSRICMYKPKLRTVALKNRS